MADLLFDTDVFIDHIRGARPLRQGRNRVSYSVVTRAELFAGPEEDEPIVRQLLSSFRQLPISTDVAERAGRVRRTTGIKAPDALIAATALEHGLPLVTRNRRDFERVPGLRLRSPA